MPEAARTVSKRTAACANFDFLPSFTVNPSAKNLLIARFCDKIIKYNA